MKNERVWNILEEMVQINHIKQRNTLLLFQSGLMKLFLLRLTWSDLQQIAFALSGVPAPLWCLMPAEAVYCLLAFLHNKYHSLIVQVLIKINNVNGAPSH